MFAVICIPDFALQAVLRNAPELHGRAVALVEAAGVNTSKALVLECSPAAHAAGVCAGFTAPQAQARCRELVLMSRSPAAEGSATEILLQTAYAFSPHIEQTAPGVCTIDLRGLPLQERSADILSASLAGLDGPRNTQKKVDVRAPSRVQQSFEFFGEAKTPTPRALHDREGLFHDWGAKIIAALGQLGLTAQVGVASTPNVALLAARGARGDARVQEVRAPVRVIDDAAEFFNTLPVAALEPPSHILEILKRWGIHTAGAFLALGKDALSERLGTEAIEMFSRASSDTVRPLNIVAPADTFDEQMEFEAHIETLEPILFVLRRFVEQLAARIALTYRVVAELHLKLTLESGAAYERTFKVPAPTANTETLFRMLHTHLENLRTDAPILSLRLSALPVRAENQQFGLFESALRDPNHFHETLARLTALLGAERVGTPVAEATHRPDSFRMKTPEFGKVPARSPENSEGANRAQRPAAGLCLRRFRPAVHAEVTVEGGRPVFLSTLVVSGPVKRARGPWCISGTWWDQRRWARQEWDIETTTGEVYCLFQSDGEWLLEGIYD